MRKDPVDERGGGHRRSVWRHADWRLLTLAQGFSGVGDWAYAVALVVWVGQRTDASPAWLAATMVVRLLPITVLAPIGGALADRMDRRRILLAADAIRCALMVALLATIAMNGPIGVGLLIAAATECATAFARPAFFSAIPTLVGEEDLAAASATGSIVNQVSLLLGPLVAGIVIAAASVRAVVVIDALTFALSFALIARIGLRTASPAADPVASAGPTPIVPRWTVRALLAVPGMTALLVLIAASEIVYGAEAVLQPLVAFDRLGSPAAVGLLAGAVGLGGFLIAPVVPRIARRVRLVTVFVVANILGAVPLMLLATTRSTVLAATILLAEGSGVVIYEVLAYILIQRSVPGAHLGRALGVREAVVTGGQLVGAFATPFLVAAAGLEVALIGFGGLLLMVSLLAWRPLRVLDVAASRRAIELEPIVAVLRESALLADATQAALEAIAASVSVIDVAAGTRVIVEGEAADHVWFVRSGTFVASTGDGTGGTRVLSEMGAGTWFGEIGVIERRPRTADVTATTDATAWRIPGSTLLAAIEGGARIADPAARLMELRLLRSAAA